MIYTWISHDIRCVSTTIARLAGAEYGWNVKPAVRFTGVSMAVSDSPRPCFIHVGWRLSKPKKSCYWEQIDPNTGRLS